MRRHNQLPRKTDSIQLTSAEKIAAERFGLKFDVYRIFYGGWYLTKPEIGTYEVFLAKVFPPGKHASKKFTDFEEALKHLIDKISHINDHLPYEWEPTRKAPQREDIIHTISNMITEDPNIFLD